MPEPVLIAIAIAIAIAAALASKSAGSLYDLVKRKFTGRHSAKAALTTAEAAAPDSAQVQSLSDKLHRAAAPTPSSPPSHTPPGRRRSSSTPIKVA